MFSPSRFLIAGALAACTTLLTGCGATNGSTLVSAPGPSAANLNGNWLLAGSLPFGTALASGNANLGVAITFAANGDQIVGGASTNLPCGAGIVTGGAGPVLTGTVASNGSFSAQTVTAVGTQLQLQGAVPASGSNSWGGTLTVTDPNCNLSQNALPFTAVRIADVSGTYAGSTTFTQTSIGTVAVQTVPASLSFVLHQDVPVGSSLPDPAALAGTVTVQGSSCFGSGNLIPEQSGVLGSTFTINVAMNDGSSLKLIGQIADTGAAKLVMSGGDASGGTCGLMLSGPFTLTRQ